MPDSSPNPFSSWHTSGGDNTRRGLFSGLVRLDPKPFRQLPGRGAIHASTPFDSVGRLFMSDLAGRVQAFDPDGRSVWRQELQGGISASPAVDSETNRLFVGTHLGWVYALDSATGTIQWKKEIPTQSDPRILSDLLYLPQKRLVVLSSWSGQFHALDHADGTTKFSWDGGISPSGGAAAGRGETMYCLRAVRDQGIELVRVSPEGLETILHRQPGEGRPASRQIAAAAPALDEVRRVVYFLANTGRQCLLLAWSEQERKMVWSFRVAGSVQATPAILADGSIVITDLAGTVHALYPNGSERYRYASGSDYLLAGAVCAADGTVFLGDPLGRMHAIDPDGRGAAIFEAPRAIQARPSFDRAGNLHLPCTDRQIRVFRNVTG